MQASPSQPGTASKVSDKDLPIPALLRFRVEGLAVESRKPAKCQRANPPNLRKFASCLRAALLGDRNTSQR